MGMSEQEQYQKGSEAQYQEHLVREARLKLIRRAEESLEGQRIIAEKKDAEKRASLEFKDDTREIWRTLGAVWHRALARSLNARNKLDEAMKPYKDIYEAKCYVANELYFDAKSELIDRVEEIDSEE